MPEWSVANNSVGRGYGKKFKRGEELFHALLKALKEGELIITPSDPRKYKGPKSIKRLPKSFVIKVKEIRPVLTLSSLMFVINE